MELGTVIVKILEVASQSNLKQLQGSAARDDDLHLIPSSCIDRVVLSPSLNYKHCTFRHVCPPDA